MPEEVELLAEDGKRHRARIRIGTSADRARLWAWRAVFRHGPARWLDREWPWDTFGETDLHLDANPEWLVLADEVEPGALGEILGVLVTTGPATVQEAGIADLLKLEGGLLWVEYVAIAPSIRPDCPAGLKRKPRLKLVGQRLMRAAIARSEAFGLSGRIGLHAEGEDARRIYTGDRWGNMREIGHAEHRAGERYPVCYGDAAWVARFRSGGPQEEGGKP